MHVNVLCQQVSHYFCCAKCTLDIYVAPILGLPCKCQTRRFAELCRPERAYRPCRALSKPVLGSSESRQPRRASILMMMERTFRRALIAIALVGLASGLTAAFLGRPLLAYGIWAAGTLPVVVTLDLDDPRSPGWAHGSRSHCVRLHERSSFSRRRSCGGGSSRHVCRRQCVRGLCDHASRTRPKITGRPSATDCAPADGKCRRGHSDRSGRSAMRSLFRPAKSSRSTA